MVKFVQLNGQFLHSYLFNSIANVLNSRVNLFINICATQWYNLCNSMVKFVQLNGQLCATEWSNLYNSMVKFVQLNGQICTILWSICSFIFIQLYCQCAEFYGTNNYLFKVSGPHKK